MDSISVKNSEVRLSINQDPARVIAFNPNDAMFANRFYTLIAHLQEKSDEIGRAAERVAAEAGQGADLYALGTQSNRMELQVMQYIRQEIDMVFGGGTAAAVFGDALDLDLVLQFFEGITPYIAKARADRLKQYDKARDRGVL